MTFDHYESPLDAYLDGQMTPEERTAFEQQIAKDADLQTAVALQRQIDAGLLRKFEPPVIEPEVTPAPIRIPAWWQRPESLAVAATILVACFGMWRWYAHDLTPSHKYWESKPATLTSAYRYSVANDMAPAWKCDNDQQFAGSVWARFGQPLALGLLPDGVEASGLGYSHTISKDSMQLLAFVNETPVVVFFDKVSADAGQTISTLEGIRTGLNLYTRTVGDIVLYEVSPLDRPHLLELWYQPEQGESWLREGAKQLGIKVEERE